MKKLALKRLTKSDLTFFRWHFENRSAGNQKAINLNAEVFVKLLFPALPEEAKLEGRGGKFSVDLDIFGPNRASRLNLQRKIIKLGEYKNWRLDGEFVHNPLDNPSRFNSLAEGDFAVFEFSGVHYPESVRLALVARADGSPMYAACESFLGQKSMAALSGEDLDRLIATIGGAEVFPITGSSIDLALEDAAQGGLEGLRKLQMRAATRPVSKEELKAARARADDIGTAGEEFVNDYFEAKKGAGEISAFSWTSLENAVAAYDFSVQVGTATILVDVKATKGDFSGPLHVSINELLHMRDAGVEYRIYRVYEMNERRATLRISEPLAGFAAKVIPILEALPDGVSADGISISPRALKFGDAVPISLEEQEE